jgi:hypothetical protein
MFLYIETNQIRLAEKSEVLATIPASAVTEISYGHDVHRRVGTATVLNLHLADHPFNLFLVIDPMSFGNVLTLHGVLSPLKYASECRFVIWPISEGLTLNLRASSTRRAGNLPGTGDELRCSENRGSP